MRKLFELLSNYHPFLLFLLLEGLCLFMITESQFFQRTRILHSANFLGGSLFSYKSGFTEYLDLKEQNDSLAKMNSELLKQQFGELVIENAVSDTIRDTTFRQLYHFQSARVINNTTNKQYNYMTVNRGQNSGIGVDMGVMSKDGIVGKVRFISANYASVMSLLNKDFTIPAKIKKNNTFGPISWDGRSSELMQLKDITESVDVRKGDTIVTSGHSTLFPENIPIGMVEKVEMQPGNLFHNIEVRPFAKMNSVKHVFVIDFVDKEELRALEAQQDE